MNTLTMHNFFLLLAVTFIMLLCSCVKTGDVEEIEKLEEQELYMGKWKLMKWCFYDLDYSAPLPPIDFSPCNAFFEFKTDNVLVASGMDQDYLDIWFSNQITFPDAFKKGYYQLALYNGMYAYILQQETSHWWHLTIPDHITYTMTVTVSKDKSVMYFGTIGGGGYHLEKNK